MNRKAEILAMKANKAYKNKNKIRERIYISVLRIFFSCDFSAKIELDESVQLIHNGLGCVFHPETKIGKNCKIYQNVTLGGNGKIIDGRPIKGAPVLEDNVAVFSGACVLGPIRIGNNSIIGANSVVTKDVPDNCVVYGNPMVITEKKFDYNFE